MNYEYLRLRMQVKNYNLMMESNALDSGVKYSTPFVVFACIKPEELSTNASFFADSDFKLSLLYSTRVE